MQVVPRHLFVEPNRMPGFLSKKSLTEVEIVSAVYRYNAAMPATTVSNESSPEIVGSQLSLTAILPGQSVLLVGIKGGYIQSLVAQLVGINGQVITLSTQEVALRICRERVEKYSPLKSIAQFHL